VDYLTLDDALYIHAEELILFGQPIARDLGSGCDGGIGWVAGVGPPESVTTLVGPCMELVPTII